MKRKKMTITTKSRKTTTQIMNTMPEKPNKSDETTYWLHGSPETYKGKRPDHELVKAAEGLSIYTIIYTMTKFINDKSKKAE